MVELKKAATLILPAHNLAQAGKALAVAGLGFNQPGGLVRLAY
jgi:hypothetical protein